MPYHTFSFIIAFVILTTSSIFATSWTRIIDTPAEAQSATAAAVPKVRSRVFFAGYFADEAFPAWADKDAVAGLYEFIDIGQELQIMLDGLAETDAGSIKIRCLVFRISRLVLPCRVKISKPR